MNGKSAMVPNVSTAASEIPVARYANSGNALTHSHSDSALWMATNASNLLGLVWTLSAQTFVLKSLALQTRDAPKQGNVRPRTENLTKMIQNLIYVKIFLKYYKYKFIYLIKYNIKQITKAAFDLLLCDNINITLNLNKSQYY